MRIAIVGSGISGLSCAWLLNKVHDITVYESSSAPGGHSRTMPMPTDSGSIPVDTGFIVYNERNYPNLTALFRHIDVATKASTMSFGVSLDNGRFEYSGSEAYATLFAQKSNLLRPTFHRMLVDIVRFNKAAMRYLRNGNARERLTLGSFLDKGRYSQAFCDRYLLPMSAAIWSANLEQMRLFPARSFLKFFENHGLLSINDRPLWRTVDGGSKVYVEKLTSTFRDRLQLGNGATRITRDGEVVFIEDQKGTVAEYDAVVLACHADQALAMIDRPTTAEQAILGAFTYQANDVVLHTDTHLMPRRRAVWSSWNYIARKTTSRHAKVSVTYWLNRLQQLKTDQPALVSLNPMHEPDEEQVVARMRYDHPLFDQHAMDAQNRLPEIQGRDRLWFAGAHWGFGFHEDGLLSGLHVASSLGASPPWWPNVLPLTVPVECTGKLPVAAATGSD
jgi:predicted NAD/FAD-binding protein